MGRIVCEWVVSFCSLSKGYNSCCFWSPQLRGGKLSVTLQLCLKVSVEGSCQNAWNESHHPFWTSNCGQCGHLTCWFISCWISVAAAFSSYWFCFLSEEAEFLKNVTCFCRHCFNIFQYVCSVQCAVCSVHSQSSVLGKNAPVTHSGLWCCLQGSSDARKG